jgi:5-methylcytosine-specific restriction endonuclease McrA
LEKLGLTHIKTIEDLVVFMKQMNTTLNTTNPHRQDTRNNKRAYDAYLYKVRAGFYAWLFKFTCQDCGLINETRTLNFHHVLPEDKEFTILMNTGKADKIKMFKEIFKCVYICENCHYQRHADMGDLDEDFTAINRRRHTYIQNLLGCPE